jgi:hypothetical protein
MRPIMLSGHERALTRECTAFSSFPFSPPLALEPER